MLLPKFLRRLLAERLTSRPRSLRKFSYGTGGLTAEYANRGLMPAVYDSYPAPNEVADD